MKKFKMGAITFLAAISIGNFAGAKEDEAPITGSIPTANLKVADYSQAAKITSNQAAKTATDAVPGQVLSIALEREDGFLVYSVEVVNAKSGLHELNIDAGNGKILSNETKGTKSSKNEENDEDDDD